RVPLAMRRFVSIWNSRSCACSQPLRNIRSWPLKANTCGMPFASRVIMPYCDMPGSLAKCPFGMSWAKRESANRRTAAAKACLIETSLRRWLYVGIESGRKEISMRTRLALAALLLLAASLPLAAQSNDLGLWVAAAQIGDTNADGSTIKFDDGRGFGASLNHFWT